MSLPCLNYWSSKEYAERLGKSAEGVKNPIVRVIMEAVAQDSLKHSLIYAALKEILKAEASLIS